MPKSGTPTRAEFERLKAACEDLRAQVQLLLQTSTEHRHELQIQFKRIAEMQAVLDGERRHDYATPPASSCGSASPNSPTS
jgi:hypothetical protein